MIILDGTTIPEGAIRRPTSIGDKSFPTARAARRAAMRSQNIPVKGSYTAKISPLPKIDQNDPTRLLFKEEIFVGKGSEKKKIGELSLHKQGHLFQDVDPNLFEPQHYHGKAGEHFTYEKGKPRSTNMTGTCH